MQSLSLLISSMALLAPLTVTVTDGFLMTAAAAAPVRLQQQQLQSAAIMNNFDLSSSSLSSLTTHTSCTTSMTAQALNQNQNQQFHQQDSVTQHSQTDNEWNAHYAQLQAFHRRHNHVRVPLRETELYDWCQLQYNMSTDEQSMQQHQKQHQQQHQHRMSKLLAVKFWDRQVQKQSWNEWYLQLMQFYIEHGHTNIAVSAEPLLAQWVHSQRTLSGGLTRHQRKLLWSINFVFDAEQADFETQYLRLLELEDDDEIVSVRQWKKLQESKTSGRGMSKSSSSRSRITASSKRKATTGVKKSTNTKNSKKQVERSTTLWKWGETQQQQELFGTNEPLQHRHKTSSV
jgi:hypothetical protein